MNAAVTRLQRSGSAAAPHRRRRILTLLSMLLPTACLVAVATGPFSLNVAEIVAIILDRAGLPAVTPFSDQQSAVLLEIRLPRVILAVISGAGLGLTGAVMQGLFRNPLADPGLIGVGSGAAVGAALAIVLGISRSTGPALLAETLLPIAAFGGGLLATLLVYRLAWHDGRVSLAVMLLAGIAVNALAGAVIGLLSYLATDVQLRNLTFWSLGSLGRADWNTVIVMIVLVVPAGVLLLQQAAALNVLLLGEAEAQHLGVDLRRLKRCGIALSALVVGAMVSACGIIGFISLVAPHLIRLTIGPDHRGVLPGACLCGALLLVLADLAARMVAAPAEVPIGIVTALMGTPFFLWLLKSRGGGDHFA